MKETVVVVAILAILAGGCSSKSPGSVGQKKQLPDGTVATLFGVDRTVKAAALLAPSPGNTLYGTDVQVCAGSTATTYNKVYFAMVMADKTRAVATLTPLKEPGLGTGQLTPGQCIRGWMTFPVPAGAKPATLTLAPGLFSSTTVTWDLPQ